MRKQYLYFLYLIILVPLGTEGVLLLLGYRPFQQVAFTIVSEPEQCLIPHTELGFALRPGRFQVTINDSLRYLTTHAADSLRITAPNTPTDPEAFKVYFFGCSYTYGMGVDDHQSMPFLAQGLRPDWITKNFGVPGYGTVQSYLQLLDCTARGDVPAVAVVNYAHFHDERNVLTPTYRRDLYLGYRRAHIAVPENMAAARIPYLTAAPAGYLIHHTPWSDIYAGWDSRENFATVNLLQNLRDQRQRRHLAPEAATLFLFRALQEHCTTHGIRLLVTGLTRSPRTAALLNTLDEAGIETLDISVDLQQPRYRNYPYDDHPSAAAHTRYARRIVNHLSAAR